MGAESPKNNDIGKVCEICHSAEHTTINHSEKGESGVEIVAVEKLIPGIKTEGLYDGERGSVFRDKIKSLSSILSGHRSEYVPYADEIARFFAFVLKEKLEFLKVFERLKGQVVVDLGAGREGQYIYTIATEMGASGYIGVELWDAEKLEKSLKQTVDNQYSKKTDNNIKLIPVSVVGEDVLTFLKRLPDESVSITAFGLHGGFLPDDYKNKVRIEIKRVLDSKGVMFCDSDLGNSLVRGVMEVPDDSKEGYLEFEIPFFTK